jgi:hypothetical protein
VRRVADLEVAEGGNGELRAPHGMDIGQGKSHGQARIDALAVPMDTQDWLVLR